MWRRRRPKPRTRAGAKSDHIPVGCAGCRMRLSGNCSGHQWLKNPNMSTSVVGRLYFLEKRDARLASCAWVQWLSRRGEGPGVAAPRRSVLLDRLEVVLRHVVDHFPAENLRLYVGSAEMQPRPDPGLDDLPECQ